MNHSIKSKSVMLLMKSALLALLVVAFIILLARENSMLRNILIVGVISGILIQVYRRRHSKSRQYDEVGYWSGIGDFDIGFDRYFYDNESDDAINFGFDFDFDNADFDYNEVSFQGQATQIK